MMKTVQISGKIHQQLKKKALEMNLTLTKLIELILTKYNEK